MKLKYMLLCLPLLFSVTMQAADDKTYDPYDDIYLTDGTVYHGYISRQSGSEREITYVSVTYTFENAKVVPAYRDSKDDKATVEANGRYYLDVTILEEGDVVTFRDDSGGRCIVQRSQIAKTVSPATEGIKDIITTKRGETYRGHIVESVPGKTVKMRLDNGRTVVILRSNMDSQQREKSDPALTTVSQSPFLERYVLNNGQEISGILTSQSYTTGLLILTEPSERGLPFSTSDIETVFKDLRPDFTVAVPPIDKDKLKVNGSVYEGIEPTFSKGSKGNVITVPTDGPLPFVVVFYGEPLVVEMNSELVPEASEASPYSFVSMTPHQESEEFFRINTNKNKDDKMTIKPTDTKVEGETTKFIYEHPERGLYALMSTTLMKILFVWVN